MLLKENFQLDNIQRLQKGYKKDPAILERAVYAGKSSYRKLAYMKKQKLEAYGYLVEAVRLLEK